MVFFFVKILLAFDFQYEKDKKKNKNEESSKKKETLEDNPTIIILKPPCIAAHIEYELVPNKLKTYNIDVLCWENAAKIYSSDDIKVFRTVNDYGYTFVPICVEHKTKDFTVDELIALNTSVIEFNIYMDHNKLGAAAKANKTEEVCIPLEDVDREGFIEASLLSQENRDSSSLKRPSNASKRRSVSSVKSEGYPREYSKLRYRKDFGDNIQEVIDHIFKMPNKNLKFLQDFKTPFYTGEDTKSLKSKNVLKSNKKSKNKKSVKLPKENLTKFTVNVQGEVFLTESNAIFKIENTSRVALGMACVMLNAKDLLTRAHKMAIDPLIIKIDSIRNFPLEVFKNSDFTGIFCQYDIPTVAFCKTLEKPISNAISFRDSHFFPTKHVPKIRLLEFLASKKLVVEIFGVQNYQHLEPEPKLFGEKHSDSNFAKIRAGTNEYGDKEEVLGKTHVLLAYSSFDLSSLLKNVWDFRQQGQVHTPEHRIKREHLPEFSTNVEKDKLDCRFWYSNKISLNAINLALITSKEMYSTTPLKEWMLIENNTVLRLEAYLLSPQSPAIVLHQIPDTYKRLMMIAFHKDVAEGLFASILNHNQMLICHESKKNDILTGILIDNGNNWLIYVEGNSIGFILNLWKSLENVSFDQAKVFFNTDQAFENRLYTFCNRWCGIYTINMKIPIQMIFNNPKVYVKGNLPILCQRALVKLNLLLLCRTMKEMLQNEIFPTLDELVSLDLEYGVPYSWKSEAIERKNIDMRRMTTLVLKD